MDSDTSKPAAYPLPLIHLNGDAPETLRDAYTDAVGALEQAIQRFEQCMPNARNYYPLGDDAHRAARAEWTRHMAALHNVLTYLIKHESHVQDVLDAREERRAARRAQS